MACKIYFFDLKECEKKFLENNKFDNFEIIPFEWSLNPQTISHLSDEDFGKAMMICVDKNSEISPDIIDKFKNLRLVSTRSVDISHIDLKKCCEKNIAIINIESEMDCEGDLKALFAGMSSYLCGAKDYRII